MKLKLHKLFFITYVLILLAAKNNAFAQGTKAQLVFGPTATYVVMNGGISGTPINLVLGNDLSTAIVPNAGGIISEGEFNYVKWMVGNTTGTNYKIPWRDNTTPSTEDVSVKFDIGTAGLAAGFFLASTYDGVVDNLTYKPTPVANMTSGATVNASAWVIDRFWSLIDETSYGATKPALNNLIFTYVANEWGGQSITEANMRAQRWNTTVSAWQGLLFGNAPVTPTQTTPALAAADLFSWWTLVDNSKPLPVEFLDLSANCERGDVTVKWSTATEQNSDYFTVERSFDGTNFSAIGNNIQAAGNSSTVQNYSFVDNDAYSGTSFYRIRETDFNGTYIFSANVTVNGCAGDDVIIYNEDGGAAVNINATEDGQYNIEMYDMLGHKIINEIKNVTAGNNHIKLNAGNIASAIYVVKVYPVGNSYGVYNNQNSIAKKIFIRSTIE